jgi:hypothetical protein
MECNKLQNRRRDLLASVKRIQRSGLQAPPGTGLFERLRRENRLIGLISGDNADGTTNIIPQMGLHALLEGYRTILSQIYSPRYYYQRVVTFLREFKTAGIETPMDLQRFLAFFGSCLRLGLIAGCACNTGN